MKHIYNGPFSVVHPSRPMIEFTVQFRKEALMWKSWGYQFFYRYVFKELG